MAAKKSAKKEAPEVVAPVEVVTSFKGFDKNMQCRGYQFEAGKTFTHDGEVKACEGGFHACEYPLDVFEYYAPADSRFATVEQSGDISRHDQDSKIASRSISIKAEISIPSLITAAFEFIKTRCEPAKEEHATGDSSASSATGYSSASSATGDSSASSATGYRSASSATGDRSASSATGDRSASSATGDRSASSATGYRSASLANGWSSTSEITPPTEDKPLHAVAAAFGGESRARAPEGSAIVLCYRNYEGHLIHIRASKVGDNGIKPNVWYSLDENGEFVEVN
jgi:hypothetical protein